MKHLIATLILLTSSASFAGLSSEDPVIAMARQRFAAAHAPSKSELNLKQDWLCMTYPARAGYYESGREYTLMFKEFAGTYQSDFNEIFVPTAQGLVFTHSDYDNYGKPNQDVVIYTTGRTDGKGNLIFELALKRSGATESKPSKDYEPSLAVTYGYAQGYAICTKTSGKHKCD